MAQLDVTSLPQEYVDALTKAQASKAAADTALQKAANSAQAATQATKQAQDDQLAAQTAVAQLSTDRQALDSVTDRVFQPAPVVGVPVTS
jgi:hypothetical protein